MVGLDKKTVVVKRHLFEVALILCTQEYMMDNTDELMEFFREVETRLRRERFKKKWIFYDEDKNSKKIENILSNYRVNREKMIRSLNKLSYSEFEDDLEDNNLLNTYMNIVNELIFTVNDEI